MTESIEARFARRSALRLAAAVLALGATANSPAQDLELLAEESAAIVPVAREARLVVRDLRGEVAVKAGKPEEVRFRSSRLGDAARSMPVALHTSGSALYLLPPETETGASTPRLLEISVPPGMSVRLELRDSTVGASGLRDRLEVTGEQIALGLRGIDGPVELDLQGGTVEGSALGREVSLKGSGLDVALGRVEGAVYGTLTDSTVRLEQVFGEVDLDLAGGSLSVEQVTGPLQLRADGVSRVELSGLAQGANLLLSETPLVLRDSKGEVMVETDAEVQFNEIEASLHVNNYGGSVRGSGNKGLVEIKTDGADVLVERIAGPVRVEGDGLNVRLKNIGGELLVYASASQVNVESASGKVTVENEFGDVTIRKATSRVQVASRDGEVRLLQLSGTAHVLADGPVVEISWVSIGRDEDSVIENARGDVTVLFPARGGCRVEAEARFGRIESELPDVRVTDDGKFASGLVGRARRPTVRIKAGGNIYLGHRRAAEDGS